MSDAVDPHALEDAFRASLQHLTAEECADLDAELASIETQPTEEPSTGLVMVTALDAFEQPFHLGEALVSTAEVAFDGVRGHATVMGDDTDRARLAAVVSAVVRHDDASDLLSGFATVFARCEARVRESLERERRLVASTRVAFESMSPEEM